MPMVNSDIAGTATVELTIREEPEGNLERFLNIHIPGCFLKNDRNLQPFVEKFIDGPADRNRFGPANSKYIFYSPVYFSQRDVTKAVLRYEQISKKWFTNGHEKKTKTCTVDNPMVITFDGHFFLCCDSEDLNKSNFLEKYSKEVRINQTLDSSKRFYGLGKEDHYLLFIPFSMSQCQSQNDIYKTNDKRDFNKLEDAGPLLLNDNKTIVGCYRKCNGNCRIKINVFGKSQGDPAPDPLPPGLTERDRTPYLPPTGSPERDRTPDQPTPGHTERDRTPDQPTPGPAEKDQAPYLLLPSPPERDRAYLPPPGPPGDNRQLGAIEHQDHKVRFPYDQLRFETIRYLDDYIKNGRGTLDELKDRFHGPLSQLTENERKEIDTVQKLVKTLEGRGVIGANDVEILKMLADALELRELKEKVEEFEGDCSGDDTRKSTIIRLEVNIKTKKEELTVNLEDVLIRTYKRNPEKLENLQLGVVLKVDSGSVVFVLKVSSISSLKLLWQSYKDGSLKEKLKKSFNEMEELKEVSQGEEIDAEVTIDEEKYHEVLFDLILLDVKGKLVKDTKSQRRHSVCCERDFPEDSSKPIDVKGKSVKDTKSQRRHSVCCERDFPKDKPMDVKEINLMATGWASPIKENINFARLCRLLIDGGTRALRDVFDSFHSPSSLRSTLLSTAVHSTLKGLKAKRIITVQQWGRLYPSSKTTSVTSANFDITLLFVLIHNICGLTPPPTGWDKPPVTTDLSREADLARVKYYRNELYGHTTETAVSDSDFEKYWTAISDVLVRLGEPHHKPEIERLKIIAMDVEDEKYFIKILEEWEQTEQSLKTVIKSSEQQVMDKLEEIEENLGVGQSTINVPYNTRVTDHSSAAIGPNASLTNVERTSDQPAEKYLSSRAQEINLMATSWASPSKENVNFARLCRLLIDGGTRALRDVFDLIHSPSSLHTTLLSTAVHSTLKGLRAKRIITIQQWGRLYPSSKTTPVTSENFDITLLFVLIRNICGLTPPPTGWDKPPVTTNLSREADLARVKYYRNALYCHTTETAVSDSVFEMYWSAISDVLVRLGGPHYKPDIERLKIEAMDPEDENYFIGALEEWEEMEQRLLQKMEEVLKIVKGSSAVDASQAKEYTEKLKLSIKKQTDFLLAEEEDKKIRTDDIFTNVAIKRGQKLKAKERKYSRRQVDEVPESRTALKTCSEMFLSPENDDQKSTAYGMTNPKSILLTGKAGIGKSLFCRKLVRDWSDDKLFEKSQEKAKVPDFQFVFLLTFRQFLLPEKEKVDLRDILNKSSLLDEHSAVDEPLLQYIIENPEKLVIILDGYDEYKHREKITGDFETRYPNSPHEKIPVPALLAKIMKGKMLRESVVVVTSKPGEAEELKEIIFDVRCDIQGFSSPQVLGYIEKYFKENESMKKKVIEHIKANEILLSFGHIPVMCYLMCYCIKWYMTESKTTDKLPVTRTELYHQVIKLFIKKHSSSKYEEMEETKVQEILHKLANLAMNLMKEGIHIFEEKDMKNFNFKEEEITNLKASGLLNCCPGVQKSPSEKPPLEYTFTHLTIHKYLCAYSFVEIEKEIPKKKNSSAVTLEFVAGMLSTKNDEKLMEELIENIKREDEDDDNKGYDDSNKLLTLSCLYEYKDDRFSTRVINNLKHIYCDEDREIRFGFMTDIDCLYISYLLKIVNLINEEQTKQHLASTQSFIVNTLSIFNSPLSASGIRMLCNSLVSKFSTVTELVLLLCNLDDECVEIISNTMSSTNITKLNLRFNYITDDGVKYLCSRLKTRGCRVKVLDLWRNDKITVGCVRWAKQQIPDVDLYV